MTSLAPSTLRHCAGPAGFICPNCGHKDKPVPLHDNLGENHRDNLGEFLPSARICVGLASISADVRGQNAAQWHLGGRAEAASGSGGRGQRVHNSLRFRLLRCDQPRCSDRCKIATDAPLLWRTILEQPELEKFLPICRRRWRHAHDLRDFTFGSEQWCHD
jgi:hypothetical protein